MLTRLSRYLKPPVFPGDEDKTFTASLLQVILWSLLVGICFYTFMASVFALIQPHMLPIAWLYVFALGTLSVVLMVVMRRGYVRAAAIAVSVGLWIILTVAAYFNGGVAAPAYGGYLVVIVCTCLLVSWQGGLVAAFASAVAGVFFLRVELPNWLPTYTFETVWSANVAYFFVTIMLLALALRAIQRASQQMRQEAAVRVKAEQALDRSEQRFRAIFNSVNDAIFVQDLNDGRILDVNQKMCEMYGYTGEEACARTIGDLSAGHAPYTQQEAIAWLQKTAGGEAQVFEWLCKDRQDRLFWVEVNMRRAALDGQERLLVVVRDIDDRKRTEATLRREQAYYEAIVNATPVMLWLKDTANRTLHLNPAAARLEGLLAADLEGRSAYELYPREQAEAFYRDDLEVIHSGQPKLGIIEQHTAAGTGKVLWMETGKVPVRDEQGNIVGVLACAVDITERKLAAQVEAATRQIADAALMTQNLDEFYQSIYGIISPLIPAGNFYIALYDAASDRFSVPYLRDEFDAEWPPYPPRQGLNAYVMRTGEPLLATPEVFAALEQQGQVEIINRRMVEWLGVPLKTPQGPLGVMAVQNYAGPSRLSESHKDLLVFVSAQVAMAIERKRAGQRLQSKEESLRLALAAARMGTWDWQVATDQWSWSDNVKEMFGFNEGEAVWTYADYLTSLVDEDRQRVVDALALALAGRGDQLLVEHRVRWPDHSVHWVESRGQVFRDAQGQPARVAGTLADVTERKGIEAELAHERDLLQSLMDNFPDTIYFKDRASRFTRVNRAQANMLGETTPEEAVGRSDADFFGTELNQMFLAEEQRLMATGEPIIDRMEYNPTPAGQPRWLSASKVPLRDAGGQIVGLVGISRDITDRILVEQREKTISQGLRAVIEAADELINCSDLDALYRRAVELAREKLKVERCGLFTLDEQGWLCGTYGTDLHRQTTDERGAHFQPINLEGLDVASSQLRKIIQSEHAYWEGEQQQVTGAGWVGVTFIRTRDHIMGVLYNDTAISRAPVDEAQQEVLAVYGSLLGSLIELKHAEEALRASETLYRRAIEAAGAVPYYLDFASESYRFMGDGILPLTGLTPAEMRPSTWDTLIQAVYPLSEAAAYSWREAAQETRAGRLSVWRADYTVLTHDGDTRWMNDAWVQVLDEAGRPRGAIGILQDITDRKEAEVALQQREAYLRSILDNFPYWIWLKDTNGRFLAVNKALANSRGYASSDELIGTSDDDLPRVLVEPNRAEDRLAPESRTQKLVEESVLVQGAERWFETFESPVVDAQGNVIGTAGFAHDITARRQAEAAMRESEMLFRYLAENAPAFIAMTDEHGTATYLNRVWQDFRGSAPGQPVAEWAERVHPDDRRRYLHEFQAALQAQRKFTTEYRLRRGDGQYRWLLDTVVPRFTADERFAGFIGIAIDITDRKNAEEALHRSESRLRLLTDNMVDTISQVDAQLRYVYVSPSVERVFGYSPRALLGRSSLELAHQDDESRLRQHILMATELHAPSLRLEYRYCHADHYHIWVEAEMRLLYDRPGNFSGAVFSVRDISARKQAETEREQLIHELEDKNAELERFTYTVSHDLKSPLITIRGFLGFLEKDAAAGNLERLRADIARIADATTRMHRLLDEMLELSRVGRMINPSQDVLFESIAREAVELVQGRIMAHGVQVEISPELPVVHGDRLRLVEVVQNLVDNAVKFMGDQAEPRVTIGILGTERAGMPIFFVQDNGIGIELEYQQRIFGLFNKLDVHSEGTGVGLALVKRIIELHSGYIWVESDGIGHGATFFFTLPRPASSSRND